MASIDIAIRQYAVKAVPVYQCAKCLRRADGMMVRAETLGVVIHPSQMSEVMTKTFKAINHDACKPPGWAVHGDRPICPQCAIKGEQQ